MWIYTGKGSNLMSQTLWCDKGNHAFSAKDLNRQHFTQTRTVEVPTGNSYGRPTYQERQEVTEELDICGPCWQTANPFTPDNGKATPKSVTMYGGDPKTEEYLKGYHDAKEED